MAYLVSETYLSGLRALIDAKRALTGLPAAGSLRKDTVYISLVDADGHACSFVNSLFESFGSFIVAGGTGIVRRNRGHGFRRLRGHPNGMAPNKRPMHTIIPAPATAGDKIEIVFGVMGGLCQPLGLSYVRANLRHYGMDPQAALDLPRYFPVAGTVEVERGSPDSLCAGLQDLGHDVAVPETPRGGGQANVIDHARGIMIGGSEPRQDGGALGY